MPIVRFTVGIFFGVILVYWLFRGTDWNGVFSTIYGAHTDHLAIGLVFMVASQMSRAMRWHVIVRQSFSTKFGAVYMASQLGLMFNYLIPARLGELIRAYLLSKESRVSTAQSIGTIIIDKSFDLIMMLAFMFILSWFIMAHGDLSIPAFLAGTQTPIVISGEIINYAIIIIGAPLGALIVLLILTYVKHSIAMRYIPRIFFFLPAQWNKRLATALEQIASGLHALKSTESLLLALLWSFIIWSFSYLAMYFIIGAFIKTSLIVPFIVLVLIAVFISVPVVPGVFGQYHLAVIFGLLFFYPDMPQEQLKSIALITHFLTLFTVVTLGALASLLTHSSNFFALLALSKNKRA